MANYGGFNYTGFRGVNLKNTAFMRLELDGGLIGTVSVRPSPDADRAWRFPDKSGTFPIMGTFNVSVAAIAAGNFQRTVIATAAVGSIRVEDGLIVTIQGDPLLNVGAIINPVQLIAASAGNGSITLTFACLGGTTTAYQEVPVAYVVAR